jgi:hypothetical protein
MHRPYTCYYCQKVFMSLGLILEHTDKCEQKIERSNNLPSNILSSNNLPSNILPSNNLPSNNIFKSLKIN